LIAALAQLPGVRETLRRTLSRAGFEEGWDFVAVA
jgi:hypothetical protein